MSINRLSEYGLVLFKGDYTPKQEHQIWSYKMIIKNCKNVPEKFLQLRDRKVETLFLEPISVSTYSDTVPDRV